jgi:hypothetical protein
MHLRTLSRVSTGPPSIMKLSPCRRWAVWRQPWFSIRSLLITETLVPVPRTNYMWSRAMARRTNAHREEWRRYNRCHRCFGSKAIERWARDPRSQSRGHEGESSIHGRRPRRAPCATCQPGPCGFSPSPALITSLNRASRCAGFSPYGQSLHGAAQQALHSNSQRRSTDRYALGVVS